MVIHNAILTGSISMQAPPVISGSLTLTGSITSTGPITGSGFFTAGTITAQTLVVQTITSSVSNITGSTKFGSIIGNTHQFTGSMFVTGGLFVANGNVGVGTISADQKLVINQGVTSTGQGVPATSGTTQNGILRLRPAVGVYGETLDFGMNVVTTYGWIQATNATSLNTNYNLALNPNGGNVGIGTSSPQSIVHASKSNSTAPTSGTTPSGYALSYGVGDGNNGGIWFSTDFGGDQGIAGIAGTRVSGYQTDLRFYTNDTNSARAFTERMRITKDGYVGIGTTNPVTNLEVSGSIGATGLRYSSSPAKQGVYLGNSSATPGTTDYATIEMCGGATGGCEIDFTKPGFDFRGRIGYDISTDYMWFVTAATEKMRIKSNGYVNVGTSGASDPVSDNQAYTQLGGSRSTFYALGGAPLGMGRGTNTGNIIEFYYNGVNGVGNISTNGSTITFSGNAASDSRLKDNIQPITNALDAINAVEFVTFKFKENNKDSAGVTAQNLQTIEKLSPFVIDGATEEDYKAVDYNAIIGYLGKAIQELNTKFEEYKTTHP